ncbi:uncharacterized protein LOC114158754 isoform X2 [Xiphophorus couchianus]|uniref:uncharacterized protein LOC114158754 isoform X2 n=1 Tax=Xiphophorus couchianus TaxID=32473 RepID=UPI0010170F36|nr:uncharacterized protein LOC114158754 isoform X2 [Xiphophorus couchianus]
MKQRAAMEDPMWRKMFLFFILQFTGALSRDLSLYYTVRAGDDVTLSCENVIDGHSNCGTTSWVYSKAGRQAVELVNLGQVKVTRSDRLSVSANCSLVVKKVTAEDVGRYNCRQFEKPGEGQFGPDAVVRLSLVHLTEHEDQNKMTLNCSVVTDEPCKHSVKWLYNGNLLDKDNKEITESSSSCSAAVAFQTSHHFYQSRFNTFKCEVKIENKVQLFTFNSRPSEKDKTTTTSAVTTKLDGTSAIRSTNTPTRDPDGEQTFLWLYITLPVLLVALITILFILLNRARGHKAKQISNDSVTLKPAETQSASENQQQVDPENGVSYASISYTKKSNSSRAKGDDEGEAVTYSTVNSPAVDPSSLYASIK